MRNSVLTDMMLIEMTINNDMLREVIKVYYTQIKETVIINILREKYYTQIKEKGIYVC